MKSNWFMRNKLGDKIRLQHILDAIQEIESYLVDVDYDSFLDNSMMKFACIKQMEIMERLAIISQMKWSQDFQLLNGGK